MIIAIGVTIGLRVNHQYKLNSALKVKLPALLEEVEDIEDTNGIEELGCIS